MVAKLFNQVRPDIAVFGEKDWQQLAVIRRMARDLDLTLPHVDRVVGVPIVREADGLAMSSRNRYLSPDNRARAAALPRHIQAAAERLRTGAAARPILDELAQQLLAAGFDSVDYAELADARSLQPLSARGASEARLFIAARIGGTRLIDNVAV